MVLNYIKKLLFEHNCVIIPQFGGIITNYATASVHPISNFIKPPVKKLAFNESLQSNDGLLINEIASYEGISQEEASSQVSVFVKKIVSQLKQGEQVKLEGIGTFSYNQEERIQFVSDETVNYLEESFGLTELYFKPIDREEEDMKRIRPTQGRPVVRRAPVRNVTDGTSTELTNEEESFDENQEAVDTTITDELALDTTGVTATVEQAVIQKTKKGDKKNKEVKEEKTKEAKSLLFLIIPVVLILGAGGAYYFTQKHQSKAAEEEIVLNETVNTTGEASVVSGLVETTTAETTSTDNNSIVSEETHHISEFDNSHSSSTTVETEHEVASSKVSTSQASSGKSYIIAGAFTQERKAKKFAATISNAQILQDGDKYRVAIGEYSTKEQAKQAIEGFKAQYGEGIWVLEN